MGPYYVKENGKGGEKIEMINPSFQIGVLKRIFVKLNPLEDPQCVDWEMVLDASVSHAENLEGFRDAYPQYKWDDSEDYTLQATNSIREQAQEYNLEVVKRGTVSKLRNERDKLRQQNGELKIDMMKNTKLDEEIHLNEDIFDTIIEDSLRIPIILNSEAGHGKSSSLKTIIKRLKTRYPQTIIKVFDISQSWFHRAPLAHRQRIQDMNFQNLSDCVFEIGGLGNEDRRLIVSLILAQDLGIRYELTMKFGPEGMKKMPHIIYVFEEANVYFGSYSLRRNDEASRVLADFISVGRNYKMRGFLVCTAERGELSPSFRRRATGRILGRVINEYDLSQLSKHVKPIVRKMPRYHFVYSHGETSRIFKVHDEVKTTPETYKPTINTEPTINVKVKPIPQTPKTPRPHTPQQTHRPSWIPKFVIGITILTILTLLI